jgi:hypothetical protein
MMRAGLSLRFDCDGAGPELGRAGAFGRDCRPPVHSERLSCRVIQLVRMDDSDALGAPATGSGAHISCPLERKLEVRYGRAPG